MKFTSPLGIVIVSCTVFCVGLWLLHNYGMVWVRENGHTGKWYFVKDKEGKEQVVQVLRQLEERGDGFVRYCKNDPVYHSDPRVILLTKRWNGRLSETSLKDASEAAYTQNKKNISICVRNKQGRVEDLNTAMFVLLHEMTHLASDCKDHPKEFWDNNKFFLFLADSSGLYTYQDFGAHSETYCGHKLNNSPLSCVKKGSCAL